jgi:hypothetical protein
MSNWRDLSRDAWSFTKNKIVGIGGGIGSNQIAYAIDLKNGILLNGKIEADIKIRKSGLAAAGLVCRADEHWTFLTVYVLYNPNTDSAFMGLGVCDRGSFRPIFALKEKVSIYDDYNRFSLEFFSGRIIGTIRMAEREYKIDQIMPHVAFPGYVGLVKLYGAEVTVKNFQPQEAITPVESERGSVYNFDVFICHSSKDKPIIEQIATDFRNRGVKCWVDAEQIGFGQSITGQIEKGLQNSKHVLVCLSPNLGKSNWCRAEYGAILHRYFSGATNKRVIPLTLDNVSDDNIPLLLYDLRRADYSDKGEFDELVNYLKS